MPDLSIIIPAAQEEHLQKTIDSIYASAKGDIEIIAVTDGYDPILYGDNRLRIIHNPTAIGQRQAINQGADYARGRFLLKLDAHCSFCDGFDTVLMHDCGPKQTVIPRMYVLDAEQWIPKWRKMTDFMHIRSPEAQEHPFRIAYYDVRCARETPEAYAAFKQAPWTHGDICQTMACLGAGFFMHRERFYELGGMDEHHAHWGQMGVEIACKSWLSGGELVVNKRTWFAHQWRDHAPWGLRQRDVDASHAYSIDFWTNNRWGKQVHELSWLVDKFAPVPTWSNTRSSITVKAKPQLRRDLPDEIPAVDVVDVLKAPDRTIVYCTDNSMPEPLLKRCQEILRKAAGSIPIICVSQKPVDFGDVRIVFGDIGRSWLSFFRQQVAGIAAANTDIVVCCEHDILYSRDHLLFSPPRDDTFYYNRSIWFGQWDDTRHQEIKGMYSYWPKDRLGFGALVVNRELVLRAYVERNTLVVKDPGIYHYVSTDKRGKMLRSKLREWNKKWRMDTFKTETPIIDLRHGSNFTRDRRGKRRCYELAHWGRLANILG